MTLTAFRPASIDGVTWSRIRREWIAAGDLKFGERMEARTAIAASIGLTHGALAHRARRCGWASGSSRRCLT